MLTFYRLEYSFNNLEFKEYFSVKETTCGYWIVPIYYESYYNKKEELENIKWKWIPKESRKRFAYPTKEEAIRNFETRTKKYIKILKARLEMAELKLYYLNDIKDKICKQKLNL